MRRPLVHVVLLLIAGQVLAKSFPAPPWSLWLGLAVVLACAIFISLARLRLDHPRPTGALVLAAFALIGALQQQRIDRKDASATNFYAGKTSRAMTLHGTVRGLPLMRLEGWAVALSDITEAESGESLPGLIQLNARPTYGKGGLQHPPLPGQRIEFRSFVSMPEKPGNPMQFDYAAYLQSRGFAATASLLGGAYAEIIEPGRSIRPFDRFLRVVHRFKNWSSDRITESAGQRWTPLMRSLLFGDTYLLEKEQKEAVTRTGLAHLMAVSGQHGVFIGLLIFALLRLAGVPWRATWVLAALGIWGFAILVGMQPPVIRAAILATTLAAAQLLGRESDSLNSLALAALIVLLWDPHSLYKADFQLSYTCVLSMILLMPGLRLLLCLDAENLPARKRRWVLAYNKVLAVPLVISIASQVALIPLLAHHFHLFPLIGFLANLLMVPLSGAIVIGGFSMLIAAAFLPPLSAAIGFACQGMLQLFDSLTRLFAAIPFASIPLPPMSAWAIGAFLLLLFSGMYLRNTDAPGMAEKARSRLIIHGLAIVALVIWLGVVRTGGSDLTVRMLDVGQGDAIVVHLPQGRTMLVDAGPPSAGSSVIVPYLRSQGIDQLNLVVATHADSDHIGGMADVLKAVPVDWLILGPSNDQTDVLRDLREVIIQKAIPVREVRRGDEISAGSDVRIRVLSPSTDDGLAGDNDRSVALRIDHGEQSFLLAADLSQEAEFELLVNEEDLDCDVLKAAHHGADSSSSVAFLNAVTPELVLVSVGRRNAFGHPNPETLERFAQQGAQVLCSDDCGSVAVSSDGVSLRVTTRRKTEGVLAGLGQSP